MEYFVSYSMEVGRMKETSYIIHIVYMTDYYLKGVLLFRN